MLTGPVKVRENKTHKKKNSNNNHQMKTRKGEGTRSALQCVSTSQNGSGSLTERV